MKKIVLLFIIFIGISTASHAQAGKETGAKKGGFFSRIFHHSDNRPRAQMHHFDRPKKDPLMKHNGTAFWRRRHKDYKVNGDGFSTPSSGNNSKRGKKSGIK